MERSRNEPDIEFCLLLWTVWACSWKLTVLALSSTDLSACSFSAEIKACASGQTVIRSRENTADVLFSEFDPNQRDSFCFDLQTKSRKMKQNMWHIFDMIQFLMLPFPPERERGVFSVTGASLKTPEDILGLFGPLSRTRMSWSVWHAVVGFSRYSRLNVLTVV